MLLCEPPAHVGSSQLISANSVQHSHINQLLDDIREDMWIVLSKRLRCKRGAHDSPVFALPLILDQSPALLAHFSVAYTWKMMCCHCGHLHEDRYLKNEIFYDKKILAEYMTL